MSASPASCLEAAVQILAAGEERICLRVERAYADHLRDLDPRQLSDPARRAKWSVVLSDLRRMYPGTGPGPIPDLDQDKAAALARRIFDFYDAVLKGAAGTRFP